VIPYPDMDKIIGQQAAVGALGAMLASGRWHHAYIFHGSAGVGKMTTALAFAQILLCHDRQTTLTGDVEACGQCESCIALRESDPQAMATLHPDLHIIRKELAKVASNTDLHRRKQMNIPVDVLREFMVGGVTGDDRFFAGPANQSANLQHGKVFMIDEAELMNTEGQNAILKTLEEPPAETYIILITSSEDRLLPTIRSRSQRIGFGLLSDEAVATWTRNTEAGAQLDDAELGWLGTFAAGSIGRAKIAIEYDLLSWYRLVREGFAAMAKGQYPFELGIEFHEATNAFAEAWVKAHDNASKEAANRRATDYLLTLITQQARLALHATAGKVSAEHAAARDQAERQLHPWLHVFEAAETCSAELASNVNMRIAMDHLVANLYAGFSRPLAGAATR